MGWIDPGTVSFATACTVLLVIPLSVANGTAAGIAHLAAVLSAWMYNFYFKRTVALLAAVRRQLRPAARVPVVRRAGRRIHGARRPSR